LEDALGLDQQPNLPGTVDEHPNWRRRMPCATAALLEDDATLRRLKILDEARHRAEHAR
jgi:4-alpha-glucanotransferase